MTRIITAKISKGYSASARKFTMQILKKTTCFNALLVKFHKGCIKNVPDEDSFDDYICRICTAKHAFLLKYQSFPGFVFQEHKSVESSDADAASVEKKRQREEVGVDEREAKRSRPEEPDSVLRAETHAAPVPAAQSEEGSACIEMYTEQNLGFLIEEEETFEPEPDQEAGASPEEIAMKELNRMDRVTALEAVYACNKLRDSLASFMDQFKGTDRVVTKADVDAFFEDLTLSAPSPVQAKHRELEEERRRRN
ncbi:hypothetical protein HK104_011252 [Borealophlyctis nickersoniae]|nr:hypothetical protein HK104_011252 [Borealophlyctis nickersoniae]